MKFVNILLDYGWLQSHSDDIFTQRGSVRTVDLRGNVWIETKLGNEEIQFLEFIRASWMDVSDQDIAKAKKLISGDKDHKNTKKYKLCGFVDFIYTFSPTEHFFVCTTGREAGKMLSYYAEADFSFPEKAKFDTVMSERDFM